MQELVERMQVMIALGADGAQLGFELVWCAQAIVDVNVHGLTSMPS